MAAKVALTQRSFARESVECRGAGEDWTNSKSENVSDAVSENVFGTVSDSEVVLLMRRFRRPQQEKFICRKVIANSGMYVMRFSKTKFTMCRGNGYGTQLGKGESAPPFLIDLRSIRTKNQ